MKTLTYILISTLLTCGIVYQNTYANGQKPGAHPKHKVKTFKDSILLKSIITFDKDAINLTNNKPNYVSVVKFTLQITNGSKIGIPDPVAYKGAKYVKLYIDGHLNNPKVLFDEKQDINDGDKIISPGQSQTFYCDWLASSHTAIQKKYGKKFNVQWSYLNIKSKKVAVDMGKRTTWIIN